MLDTIRKVAEQKRISINSSDNCRQEYIAIIDIIIDLLKDDICFLDMDISLAIRILCFLGYSREDAGNIYVELIHECSKALKGKYTMIEPNIVLKNN